MVHIRFGSISLSRKCSSSPGLCGDFVRLSCRYLLQRPGIAIWITEGDEGAPRLNIDLARRWQ
jgi:hypothetical protein